MLIKTNKIKKLISCPSSSQEVNELWLFEGNSASNGFRNARNLYQAAYLLRGKITNTLDLKKTQIIENLELREILAALGILFDDAKNNVKNCKFAKIIIASDMDYDGNHICGLLLAFFAKHFPELIKACKIYRALSPIIVCSKDNKKQYFYSLDDYKLNEHTLKGWEINYTKGLGGLDDNDYREMVRNQRLIQFTIEDMQDLESVNVWFGKSSEIRKQILLEDESVILEEVA
jgi:DNA gyrase/topoisomerase IV subunit B